MGCEAGHPGGGAEWSVRKHRATARGCDFPRFPPDRPAARETIEPPASGGRAPPAGRRGVVRRTLNMIMYMRQPGSRPVTGGHTGREPDDLRAPHRLSAAPCAGRSPGAAALIAMAPRAAASAPRGPLSRRPPARRPVRADGRSRGCAPRTPRLGKPANGRRNPGKDGNGRRGRAAPEHVSVSPVRAPDGAGMNGVRIRTADAYIPPGRTTRREFHSVTCRNRFLSHSVEPGQGYSGVFVRSPSSRLEE